MNRSRDFRPFSRWQDFLLALAVALGGTLFPVVAVIASFCFPITTVVTAGTLASFTLAITVKEFRAYLTKSPTYSVRNLALTVVCVPPFVVTTALLAHRLW